MTGWQGLTRPGTRVSLANEGAAIGKLVRSRLTAIGKWPEVSGNVVGAGTVTESANAGATLLPDGTVLEGEIDLSLSQFAIGDPVDVIGQSKGKGFQGIMKKHNTKGQGQSHGSMMHRRPGAIGMRSTPGRIWKNQSMPGHMGDERVTVQNLRVVQVREEDGVILIAGAVPGAKGCYVVIRPAKKAKPQPAAK